MVYNNKYGVVTPHISILLPTRKRPHLLRRFLDSVWHTATSPEQLEIILYIDNDDAAGSDFSYTGLAIHTLIGPRQGMGCMHSSIYEASAGRYILLTGDDAVFRTPGWDTRLLTKAAEFPDGVLCFYGNDLLQGPNMATMPFLSRTVCDLLGGPCPKDYQAEFIDTHIMDIFLKLRLWGYDRLLYFKDLIFEHMHHVNGKGTFDEVYVKSMSTEQSRSLYFSLDAHRVAGAEALVAHIRSCNGPKKYLAEPSDAGI